MNDLFTKLKVIVPIYILFVVSAVLFHSYFILSSAYFVENCCDSLKQITYFQVFLNRFFEDGFQMWSWNYGIGGDVFGQFIYYYTTSPFFWITFLATSIQNLQNVFEIRLWVSIGKLVLTMIFMFNFLRYFNRTNISSILGSLIYGGSIYFTFYSLRYDFLVDGMVFLPLLLLGFEKYTRENKKGLLIFSVFLTVCSNFYLAFINSIFLGIFIIFSYFYNEKKFTIKEFTIYTFRFGGIYALGLLLASFSFLPAVYNFTQVDRFFYDLKLPLFFQFNFYKALPYDFLFMTTQYQVVASIPIISFLLLLSTILIRKHLSVFILTIFVFLLALLPFSYSMFNGFSSVQFRWLYLVVFVIAFSSSFIFDNLHSIKNRYWVFIGMIGMTIMMSLVLLKKELINVYASEYDIVILTIATAAIFLLIIRSYIPYKVFTTLLIGLTIFNLVFTNYSLFTNFLGEKNSFVNRQQVILNSSNYGLDSEEDLFNDLRINDSAFYRVVWDNQKEINAPLLYDYHGMSIYNSMLDGSVHRFFKRDMNTLQQNAPSMFKNADNRIYIETLLSTGYYVMDKNNKYIPYGYNPIKEYEKLLLLKNQNTLPIGSSFSSFLPKKKFDQLTMSQKDEALLSTIIVDDPINSMPEFDIGELEAYTEVIKLDEITLENGTRKNNLLIVKPYNGLTIPLQLPLGDGETKVEIGIQRIDGKKFTMTANDKTFIYNGDNFTYSYPQDVVVFNLMNTINEKGIRIELTPGTYKLESVKIHYNGYDKLNKLISERQKESLQNVMIEKDSIIGEIELETDGFLFMSVPFSKGWNFIVDGQPVEAMKVQSTFIGIPLEKGNHKIEMQFRSPLLLEGFLLSLSTLFALVIWSIWKKSRKRNDEI